jgi:transposase
MWKPEHRRPAERRGLRYPSDLTDAALVEPMIPPAKHGGRRREVNVREVLNAIFYVLSTGCQWQALPKDLPPKSMVHSYFMLWDWRHIPTKPGGPRNQAAADLLAIFLDKVTKFQPPTRQ